MAYYLAVANASLEFGSCGNAIGTLVIQAEPELPLSTHSNTCAEVQFLNIY